MNPTPNMIQSSKDEIEQLAHSIWEQEGRPEGRSLEHWLMAENQLRHSVQNATDINQQSSVVAPAEPNNAKNSRGSKGEVGGRRQSAPPLAPPNRIGRA